MNKSDLTKQLAEKLNLPMSSSKEIVDSFFDSMTEELAKGGHVEIRGFGSFKTKPYGSYTGRNPKTGEKVTVSKKMGIVFKPGKAMQELLNDED